MLSEPALFRDEQAIAAELSEAGEFRQAFVVGGATETNRALAAAFAVQGYRSEVTSARGALSAAGSGDLVLNRIDVLPSLDGVEQGFWTMFRTERTGATVLNRPASLLGAHDKLATSLLLARAGVRQPRTAHVREARVPETLRPPYVVKPRFGSWGRDVVRCDTADDLRRQLERLSHRHWFRRQGALVQELVLPTGRDVRLLVAAGRVSGAIERIAVPGEWRTNVALGASRRATEPPLEACVLALRAVEAVGLDLAGVDLLIDAEGGYLVLEINGAVDFTVDYSQGPNPFLIVAEALLARPEPVIAFTF